MKRRIIVGVMLSYILIASCGQNEDTAILGNYFLPGQLDAPIDSTCIKLSPSIYENYDIPEMCTEVLYHEKFDEDKNWYTDSRSGCTFLISSNKYYCECDDDTNFYLTCWRCLDHEFDNYQIDVDIEIFNSGKPCSLNWGGLDDDDLYYKNTYRFGINGEGQFILAKVQNGEHVDPDPMPLQPSQFIKNNDSNKLTIRKINDTHYLFINENLVSTQENLRTFGNRISLRVGANSSCQFDNFKLTKIFSN